VVKLLIVESPGKIKKLKSILGAGWQIEASFGHITHLSDEGKYSLGFEIGDGSIDCKYVARSDRAKATIAKLQAAAQRADEVILASDPDREGETIAWHIAQTLQLKNPKRVVYQSITDNAVRQAIQNPRAIDSNLVAAGRCRDCLDKLVGYRGSPLVWRLNNGAKSIGRVQSAALHLVCQREREILNFKPQDYWSVYVEYAEGFKAFYFGDQAAAETDEVLDDAGTEAKKPESTKVLTQAEADRLVATAQSQPHQVVSIEAKQTKKFPPTAFSTSALQQTAGAKLKFSPDRTMALAQKLYEAGLISYMRTDSVELSAECISQGREWLTAKDLQNLPTKAPKASTAAKNATKNTQEGHEAIRPTNFFKSSQELKTEIPDDEFSLYLLIWKRTMATLCKPALLNKSVIVSQSGSVRWQARGQVVAFPGYLKYWHNLSGDNELPIVIKDQFLTCEKATAEAKQTQPPARFTEAQLVQQMEKKGIGRPSTFAPTITTIKERNYVQIMQKDRLSPTTLGMEVDDFLAKVLPDLLEPSFTAQMENSLDSIAAGKLDWEKYLSSWNGSYLEPALLKAEAFTPPRIYQDRELPRSRVACPDCQKMLGKIPFHKSPKGYFLKCDKGGCKSADGRELVLFWSDFKQEWVKPGAAVDKNNLVISEVACRQCSQLMAKIPSTKVSGGFYLKCQTCKDSVMFWDGRSAKWQAPAGKTPVQENRKETSNVVVTRTKSSTKAETSSRKTTARKSTKSNQKE
jgi:DNA topoisomerase I